MNSRERLIVKIHTMLHNNAERRKHKKEYLKEKDLLQLMDEVRKTQHPTISFDEMINMLDDMNKAWKELEATTKYI
jgi:hypothetical protein